MTRFGLSSLQERVKIAVEAEGLRPFARRAGVGIGVVRSMLEGRDASYSSADALARALNIELGFGPVNTEPSPASPDEFVNIPWHDKTPSHVAFRRDWIEQIGIQPAHAALAYVECDSMAPFIRSGDVVLLNRAERELPVSKPRSSGEEPAPVFAAMHRGKVCVKRISRPQSGFVILQSDNPECGLEYLTGADIDALHIIGRVVWCSHMMRTVSGRTA